MRSSLHQWESDPLFSAAEVVQDSADRMESLFRLLLHEQSLLEGDHTPRLVTSIEYHKRDLATILETAKWQLEDFERAVNSSAVADKSRSREDVISRHRQFIGAIREQINHVQKSVDGPSTRDSTTNSEWVNLNERDGDSLALFLTGGNPTGQQSQYDWENGSILSRYHDPTSASSLKDNEIVEHDSREFKNGKMNSQLHLDQYLEYAKEDNLCTVDSRNFTRLENSLPQISCNGHDDDHRDLEANEAIPRSFFLENKLTGFNSRMNFSGYLKSLWTMYGSRVSRKYAKRLKDGEELRHSPTYIDVSISTQGQHTRLRLAGCRSFQGLCSATYQRLPWHVQFNQHPIQIMLTIILTLVFLGVLVSRIA